jgi:hypothetical protein
MPKGQQVFKEYCEDCPDSKKVVRRDAAFADNALLPQRFRELCGDRIYDGLLNGFRVGRAGEGTGGEGAALIATQQLPQRPVPSHPPTHTHAHAAGGGVWRARAAPSLRERRAARVSRVVANGYHGWPRVLPISERGAPR